MADNNDLIWYAEGISSEHSFWNLKDFPESQGLAMWTHLEKCSWTNRLCALRPLRFGACKKPGHNSPGRFWYNFKRVDQCVPTDLIILTRKGEVQQNCPPEGMCSQSRMNEYWLCRLKIREVISDSEHKVTLILLPLLHSKYSNSNLLTVLSD